MKCLYCDKELDENSINNWHKKCIKSFFKTTNLPKIDLADINELGNEMVTSKKTITGVQKKLSFHLEDYNNEPKLTLVGYPSGYILKPNTKEYPFIAEAEYLVMKMAKLCHVNTTDCALLEVNNEKYYITKRIDRVGNNKIHMEDFCQLSEKVTEYKYDGSYEKCMKIIDKYSCIKELDKIELFRRLVYSYITLNSDMHLKNFSLIETSDGFDMSSQYDLLPVQLIINDNEDMALTLNGKKKNLTKNDFIKFAISGGISKENAIRNINSIIKEKDKMIDMINDSYLPENKKEEFVSKLNERIERLK